VQRVDLIVDGVVRNRNQKSDLAAFQKRVTASYQTGRETIVRRSVPTPPVPPNPPPMLTLQRTLFWAQITDDAVTFATQLHGWRHALTADTPYAPTADQVKRLKDSSPGVDAWGVQTQIPPAQIADFHQKWGLDRIIHQAENPVEAATVQAQYMIGNLTRDGLGDQFDRLNALVKAGKLGATTEVYNGSPETYDTNGFVASSFTLGVWLDNRVHIPLRGLIATMRGVPRLVGLVPGVCIWHGNNTLIDPDDRAVLMSL